MIKLTRKQYEIEEPIQVADENGNLLVDYTVKITPEEKALGIPITAVQGEFGGYFVFVRHGQHFERREVFVGHKTGNMIEVDGVREGEEVVTLGSHQLRYAAVKPLAAHEHSVNEETRE